MEKMFEVISIKQEIKEVSEKYQKFAQAQIKSPDDVAEIAIDLIGSEDREIFLVIVLNVKLQVIAIHKAHVGSLNASIVNPREVFKSAILNNGANIIVCHNHPSLSNITPSQEDIQVTKRLVECGHILDIQVQDHLIVNNEKYISLKEKGYI